MEYGVCHIAIIPLRALPSEKSEMVSQLLFGELYQFLEEEENWVKIETCDCLYQGWISKSLFNSIPTPNAEKYINSKKFFLKELILNIENVNAGTIFPIYKGSSFPYPENEILNLGKQAYKIRLPQQEEEIKATDSSTELTTFATSYLESPYLWGGRSPAGIDCSGFVQIIYKSLDINLPRDASQQVSLGEPVDFINEAEIGDVAFFENQEGKIIHTGIILANQNIIHASGKVRLDKIDQTGIFNREFNKYTHFLRIIKRFL